MSEREDEREEGKKSENIYKGNIVYSCENLGGFKYFMGDIYKPPKYLSYAGHPKRMGETVAVLGKSWQPYRVKSNWTA